MEDGQRQEIVKAVEQVLNNIYEAKAAIAKGSYEDPYLFVCSEETAKKIKKLVSVDENNIFLNSGVYIQLGVQGPLKGATLEVGARAFEKAKDEVK